MAIWQFKFDLLPESGFKRLHGGLLPNLSFARSPAGPRLVREAQEEVNYWAGSDPFSLIPDIQTLLPERKSWSEDARMFGNEEGDAVEVWADLVFCAADMRAISKEFLDGILETAIKNELLLVLNENAVVLRPIVGQLVPFIEVSRAHRFCKSPSDVLKEFRNRL